MTISKADLSVISIVSLEPETLSQHLKAILKIDQRMKAERWSAVNFTMELPGKWELSRLALDDSQLVGYMIATLKTESVHVNRIAVDDAFQRSGIGKLLLCDAAQSALAFQKPLVTLKVSCKNKAAINFYQRRGFIQQDVNVQDLILQVDPRVLLAKSSAGNT